MMSFNILHALYRVDDKRALFEVISPIKILSAPHLGLGQSPILTGYSCILS